MSRAGGGEMLFYVRRHTCAGGAFERYVLNGHMRRREHILSDQRGAQQWRGSFVRRPVNGDPRRRFPTGFGQIKPRLDRGDQRGFLRSAFLDGAKLST